MLCGISVILDAIGFRGEIIDQVKKYYGYFIQVILRSDPSKRNFQPVHRKWIVERTFAWFDNDRRVCRYYELLIENAKKIVKLSAIKYLLNTIQTGPWTEFGVCLCFYAFDE